MAEALVNHIASARGLPLRGLSAGTGVAPAINPVAVEAMMEIGISMNTQFPKRLTQ